MNQFAGWFIDDVTLGAGGQNKVAAVTFNPPPSTYSAPISVTLSCATVGATIRYTTDGTDPTTSSPMYNTSISVTTTITIKAKAYKAGLTESDPVVGVYTIEPPASLFSDTLENPQNWTTTGLWQFIDVDDLGGPNHAAYYGRIPEYDYDTGAVTAGFLTVGKPIALPPDVNGVAISFDMIREVEFVLGSYDRTFLQVKLGDDAWKTIWLRDSQDPSDKQWTSITATPFSIPSDLAPRTLWIRFGFDSIDRWYNDYFGWVVDNIEVAAVPEAPPLATLSLSGSNIERRPPANLTVINMPNPVRDFHTTTFMVRGQDVEAIRVRIYDLAGALVYEEEISGSEMTWHTENLYGEYLANGVYLYRASVLVDGTWIETTVQKLVILR
jgi:hypothetical protein